MRISGPDALTFLQAITTQDIAAIPSGTFSRSAILDKKSHLLADFFVASQKLDNGAPELLLLTQTFQIPKILELLESYHFAEDVKIETLSTTSRIFSFQGAAWTEWRECSFFKNGVRGSLDLSGDGGMAFIGELNDFPAFEKLASEKNISFHSPEILDLLMLEAGLPIYSRDIDASIMAMEVWNYESLIDFKKGCYPGQEIVARTYSQGEVRRRLFGLTSETPFDFPAGSPRGFLLSGKKVGEIRRTAFSPSLKTHIALSFLPREMAYPGMEFEIQLEGSEKKSRVRVAKPPFYVRPSLSAEARRDYEEGIDLYHLGEWLEAQKKFEASFARIPSPDVCEALAMTSERLGKTEEAISWNQRFAELDPNAVLARTNLSRLYMQKGWIERAEKEQAKATTLGFRLAAAEAAGKKSVSGAAFTPPNEEEAKAREEAEGLRKKKIFEQVLGMDPDDEVANFGLGKWYFDRSQFAEALPFLQKIVANNDQYSMAYLLLGKTLLGLDKKAEARLIIQKGISVAKAKGDLMPLRGMEEILGKSASKS